MQFSTGISAASWYIWLRAHLHFSLRRKCTCSIRDMANGPYREKWWPCGIGRALVHDAASNDIYEHLPCVRHCSNSTPQKLSPSSPVYKPDVTLPLINPEIFDQIVNLFSLYKFREKLPSLFICWNCMDQVN